MELIQSALLGLVQGVTEFLPISSSGHLIILKDVFGITELSKEFDAAVHLGTLIASIVVFRNEIGDLIKDILKKPLDTDTFSLLAPTAVVLAVAYFFRDSFEIENIFVVAGMLALLGIVFLFFPGQKRKEKKSKFVLPGFLSTFLIGVSQILALIPGTSRSGITITGARRLGYPREDAARLAMLMSIPTIMASGALLGTEVTLTANAQLARDGAIAAAFSFVAALTALWGMMRLLRHVSFTPYVVYRLIFGSILLWIAYS